MKLSNRSERTIPVFIPVTLEITCETQKELDAISTLFCSSTVRRALQRISGFEASSLTLYKLLDHLEYATNITEFHDELRRLS